MNWPPKTLKCDITGVEYPNPDYEIALYFCQVGIVKGIDMMAAIQTQDRLDPVKCIKRHSTVMSEDAIIPQEVGE